MSIRSQNLRNLRLNSWVISFKSGAMNSGCFFPFSLCALLLSFALSSCFLGVRVESQIPGVIGSGKDIDTDQPSRSNPEKDR